MRFAPRGVTMTPAPFRAAIEGGAMRSLPVVLAALAAAATFVVVPTASSAGQVGGQVDLTSTLTAPCTFTAQVNYSSKNAPTLEIYVTEGFDGTPLVPATVAVKKNTAGTVTVTLAPLAASETVNNFYVWAQLLDRYGAPVGGIGYGLDFASISTAYCTAP
jgi:hypothetical protein